MADGTSSFTVKYGKDFNAPWFVASGSVEKIREDLIEFAKLDPETVKDLSLMELGAHVSQLAQGRSALRSQLGAKLEPLRGAPAPRQEPNGSPKKPEPAKKTAARKPAAKKALAKKVEPPTEDTKPGDDLLAQIENAADLDELKVVLKEHNDEIRKNSQLKEAVKKRNASFKA